MPYSTDTHSTSAEGDYNGDFSSDVDFSNDDVNAWEGLSGSAVAGSTLESLLEDALQKGKTAGEALSAEAVESIMSQMLEGTTLAEIKNISVESLELLYSVAYQFYTSGNYAKAALFFQNLILLNHWDKRYQYGLAACLQGQKLYEEALQVYGALYFMDAGNPDLCLNAGVCRLAMGDRAEAEDGFKMALEIARGKKQHQATFDRAEALIAHMQHRGSQRRARGAGSSSRPEKAERVQ